MSDRSMLRRLWPHLRPDAWAFSLALVLTPATASLSLVQPWILKKVIDEHLVPGVANGLMTLGLAYLGAVVLGYVLEGGYVMALAWGGQRSIVRLRSAVYRKLLGLRQSYLDRQPAGRLLTRATSDIDALGEALSSGLIDIVLDLLMIAGTLVAILRFLGQGLENHFFEIFRYMRIGQQQGRRINIQYLERDRGE